MLFLKFLGIVSLSRATNLREIISETSKESPILIVLSPLGGADPTKELTELFEDVKPKDTYHEVFYNLLFINLIKINIHSMNHF